MWSVTAVHRRADGLRNVKICVELVTLERCWKGGGWFDTHKKKKAQSGRGWLCLCLSAFITPQVPTCADTVEPLQ